MNLDERVALVTGANRGIGAGTAIKLAAHGAAVAVHYFSDEARAAKVVDEINKNGGKAFAVQADVTEKKQVERMVEQCNERFGPVDFLVNGARQLANKKPFLELDWSDYAPQIDSVLKGTFNCCQAVLGTMIERKFGRIINMLSTSLYEPSWQWHTYGAAKGAVLQLTRNLAAEMGPFNITVNAISPGHVPTERPSRNPAEHHKQVLALTPMGRYAQIDEVADGIVFLCSDYAGFVTGVNLPICGGKLML